MQIDLFEFARGHRSVSGTTGLDALPRIDTPDRTHSLAWSAEGSNRGRHGALRIDLAIDGAVVLTCQRCLKPMSESLALRSKFLVAASEEAADALDQDDEYDAIVGSESFELDALIEDEVILALPIAPRHAVCPDGAAVPDAKRVRPSPFAALASLKRGDGGIGPGDAD